MKKIKVWSRG